MRESVAVIGNCYFDEIYTIDTYPKQDSKILASDLKIMLGGSATNTSVGLVKLGMNTYLFTIMGDDPDAYRLFKKVRKKGINSQYINHIKGKSGRTIILLDKSKSSTKIGYQGVCSDLSKDVTFAGLSNPIFSHVHLSSVGIPAIKKALEYKSNQTYSLDFGAKTMMASDEELLEVLPKLDLVFMNRTTYERLHQTPLNELASLKLKYDLIITAGTDGIYALISGKTYHQSIIPTEVVDTTGAGDAVAAAIVFASLSDLDPQKMLLYGVKAASIKIKTYGGSNGHAKISDLNSDE